MAVAPDVVRGDRTLSPACEWRDQPVGSAADVFGKARSEREGKRAEEAARREHDDAVRKIGRLLTDAGLPTSRWKARDLMGRMGIESTAPMPPLPGPSRESKRLPYPPRGRPALFPDQAWSLGKTYVRLGATTCAWSRSSTGTAAASSAGGSRTRCGPARRSRAGARPGP